MLALPSDILIIIIAYLSIDELVAVSETCSDLHSLVCTFGWTTYLRSNPRPSFSLSKSRERWSPKDQVRYNTLTDRAWSRTSFVARPLSNSWKGKSQPLLAISPSRLVVAAGRTIYSYKFTSSSLEDEAPSVKPEGFCMLKQQRDRHRYITSAVFLPDGGLDRTLAIAFDDGALDLVYLSLSPNGRLEAAMMNVRRDDDFIECLSRDGNILLSLSSNGRATLMDITADPSPPSPSISLNARSWSAHLSLHSSTPYAAFGTSSSTPLTVHPITPSHLTPTPTSILSPHSSTNSDTFSAVYGITTIPPSSPLGSPDNILVSGWYDGIVRIHDLRSSRHPVSTSTSTTSSTDRRAAAPSLPVLLGLCDPWCPEPIYSVSCGGGSSSIIAAGSARHSVVSFWDVRTPKVGWSVHAPGNDSSPVYTVILESSRLFGATQSRPFVYDFGPGVTRDTFPHLQPTSRFDGLNFRYDSQGISYYVTKYHHRQTSTPIDGSRCNDSI